MQLEDILDNLLNTQTAIVFAVGLLLGASLIVGMERFTGSSGEATTQELISTLEKSSGQNFELVNLDTRNGLYRAQIKNQNDQLTTYYITKDGNMIIQESGMTNLQQFSQQVDAQVAFTDCMAEKNVVMYGNLSQQETVAQVQLLGGANHVSDIYVDITQHENLVEAINRGIQRIPAFYYNNSTLQGVQSINNLENFTGCAFNATN